MTTTFVEKANWLKGLVTTRVSLVDAGANQEAEILLFKRKGGETFEEKLARLEATYLTTKAEDQPTTPLLPHETAPVDLTRPGGADVMRLAALARKIADDEGISLGDAYLRASLTAEGARIRADLAAAQGDKAGSSDWRKRAEKLEAQDAAAAVSEAQDVTKASDPAGRLLARAKEVAERDGIALADAMTKTLYSVEGMNLRADHEEKVRGDEATATDWRIAAGSKAMHRL